MHWFPWSESVSFWKTGHHPFPVFTMGSHSWQLKQHAFMGSVWELGLKFSPFGQEIGEVARVLSEGFDVVLHPLRSSLIPGSGFEKH